MDPSALTYQFRSFDTLIDQVHGLFDAWEAESVFPDAIGLRTVYLLKLAVHEWLANLIQHADFNGAAPHVAMCVHSEGNALHCRIEDNSKGFDLNAYLSNAPPAIDAFPERGTGLLILQSCTEDLTYESLDSGVNRLSFTVSANQDPWLSIQF